MAVPAVRPQMSNLPGTPNLLTQIKVGLFSMAIEEGVLNTSEGKRREIQSLLLE